MRAAGICIVMSVLLLSACSDRRQDSAAGQEAASAQGLIHAGEGSGDSSPSEQAAGFQTEAGPVSDLPPPSAGENPGTDLSAPAGQSGREGESMPSQSISSFDFDSARIEPTCYLPERDSFLSKSYHDFSALYLVGFSPDGKMAFFREVELDGKGGMDLSFIIQDLVSDEILWELKAPDDETYGYEEGLHKRFVADYGSQIDKKISTYGIVIAPCEYRSTPYSADGLSLSASIESYATGKMMYDMFELTSYSCVVTDGRGRSKKVIAGREFMGPEAFVCGCVKNPYEDRLALVIAEATYGFEGCDLLMSIVGCDLRKGF